MDAEKNPYSSLALVYDALFPVQTDLISTLGKPLPGKNRLLDVGGGTGAFAEVLRKSGWQVEIAEPDGEMAALAEQRGFPVYRMGMASSELRKSRLTFHRITCLGNTLPHCRNLGELVYFLETCQLLLRGDSALLIQFIRFETLKQKHPGEFIFPVLEAEGAAFHRSYRWEGDHVRFLTTFIDPEGNRHDAEQTLLFLRREEVRESLISAGFSGIAVEEGETAWLVRARRR